MSTFQIRLHNLRRKASQQKTALYKQLRQHWHNPGKPGSRPAFLLGCGRSGTSMLVLQLGRSWQIDVYNESNPAAFDHWRLRPLPVIREIVGRSRASFTLFKPILDTYRACLLLDNFPEAKILFAFRHYDDVVNSSLKKFGVNNRITHVNAWVGEDFAEFADLRPPAETEAFIRTHWQPGLSPESGAALYWLFQNRLFFDLGLVADRRVRLVCYESVVNHPATELTAICDFLQIRFEPAMAAGIFASSVQHAPAPAIAEHLRQTCDAMWQQLCQQAGDLAAVSG
jgi:hypothetical protein